MDLSIEMNRRMEEASKDKAWVEKLCDATTWEEFAQLLAIKNIEVQGELKEAFIASHAFKTEKLEDEELEKVSGGLFGEPVVCGGHGYSILSCDVLCCPYSYISWRNSQPEDVAAFCKRGYWGTRYGNGFNGNDGTYTTIPKILKGCI